RVCSVWSCGIRPVRSPRKSTRGSARRPRRCCETWCGRRKESAFGGQGNPHPAVFAIVRNKGLSLYGTEKNLPKNGGSEVAAPRTVATLSKQGPCKFGSL